MRWSINVPIEVENEEGEFAIAYARRLGKNDVVNYLQYLQSIIDQLSQRDRDTFQVGH